MKSNQLFNLDIGWKALLRDFGLNADQILRRAKLPEDLFGRTGAQLTPEEYFRFWLSLEVEANNPLFSVRLVDAISAEIFSPPIFAALCSENLMQATQRLAKYKHLIAPMALDLHTAKNGDFCISPRWLTPGLDIPISLELAEIAFFMKLLRLATRENISAKKVTLSKEITASSSKAYEKFFGCPIEISQKASISFSYLDTMKPFLTKNVGMWNVFEPDLRRRLSELDTSATATAQVQSLLLELIPSNNATVDAVAIRLGISKRTLQRRLDDEGKNFRALVAEMREKLATHYLKNTNLPSAEIAFLLGFEDPNSFFRAFHDWTGKTPDTARHAARLN